MFRKILLSVAFVVAVAGMSACGEGGAVDTAKLSGDLGSLLSKATEQLGSITDLASAKEALPELKNVDGELGGLIDKAKALAPDMQSKVAAVAQKAMPALEGAVEKIMSIDGVKTTLGPIVDSMMDKLKSLG